MNLTELYKRRDEKKSKLALAYLVRDSNIVRVSVDAAANLEQTISVLEKELASVGGAIAAIEAVEQSGTEQPVEAIESDVIDVVRYASVVVGVGYDPDDPEQAFVRSTARSSKRYLCELQIAQLLRTIADRFEANHSHAHGDDQ